jgi:hypothetical protein
MIHVERNNIKTNTTFEVQTGAKVKLLAGNQIVLRRGFSAKRGTFEARIEPCNNVVMKNAEDNDVEIPNEYIEEDKIINPAEFSVFPNPTNGEVSMCYTLENDSYVLLEIYNELGVLVKTELSLQNQQADIYYYNFSIEDLPTAFYILSLKTNNKNYSYKIIKN